MLKLNMTDFIRSLDSLPESNENEPLFGTGYLTEHVALPFLFGKDISLYEIDWGCFPAGGRPRHVLPLRRSRQLGGPVLQLYQPAVYTKPAPQPQIFYV